MKLIKKKPLNYKTMIKQHMKILKSLQFKSGLFSASKHDVGTGYDKAWLRDNFYECIAFEVLGDWDTVRQTYRALLDIFKKHEFKIDSAILKKPAYTHQYIHARYHPETFNEFWEEWGNKQNDSVGCILFKIGELEKERGIKILESEDDYRIVQKLVDYLSTLEYWHDPDSGMWEEDQEVHASSIGACVAGLEMVKNIEGIEVHEDIIKKGYQALARLLPRESQRKFVDLALLPLIWPYEVTTKSQTREILSNVEYHLLKNKGVIRYKSDEYYNKNLDNVSEEAEWTFGLFWLAIIYEKLGMKKKAKKFMEQSIGTVTKNGEVPELYYSNTNKPNDNTPLGWSESLFITALYYVNKGHMNGGRKKKAVKKVVRKKVKKVVKKRTRKSVKKKVSKK
jgi:GH15 family glucan-1,4-alpha-glucosidase